MSYTKGDPQESRCAKYNVPIVPLSDKRFVGSSTSLRQGATFQGTYIDAITWDKALHGITAWATARESRYICICNVHVVVTSWKDTDMRDAIHNSDMSTPDGMPLVWQMRKHGYPQQERIDGPDLMKKSLRSAESLDLPVFFYGSTSEILEKLVAATRRFFPNLRVVGALSPPFRPLTRNEDELTVDLINSSGASVVFVGLGCPKQELWMAQHKGRIHGVMIGVGAAFDFFAGNAKRAPRFMRNHGLEWLYRLTQDSKRLWKRYLITNTLFLFHWLRGGMCKKVVR